MDAHQVFDEMCDWKVSPVIFEVELYTCVSLVIFEVELYMCVSPVIFEVEQYMCIITSDISIWLNRANHIKHTENETIDI